MTTLHHFPEGDSFVGHGREDCDCNPRRSVTFAQSGGYAAHKPTAHYWHNAHA